MDALMFAGITVVLGVFVGWPLWHWRRIQRAEKEAFRESSRVTDYRSRGHFVRVVDNTRVPVSVPDQPMGTVLSFVPYDNRPGGEATVLLDIPHASHDTHGGDGGGDGGDGGGDGGGGGCGGGGGD